jgi:hypothetical protein
VFARPTFIILNGNKQSSTLFAPKTKLQQKKLIEIVILLELLSLL